MSAVILSNKWPIHHSQLLFKLVFLEHFWLSTSKPCWLLSSIYCWHTIWHSNDKIVPTSIRYSTFWLHFLKSVKALLSTKIVIFNTVIWLWRESGDRHIKLWSCVQSDKIKRNNHLFDMCAWSVETLRGRHQIYLDKFEHISYVSIWQY